jgi:ABC-2 type transport system permease protein
MTAGNRLSPGQFVAGVRSIAAREAGAAFDGAIAYVYVIAFVVLSNSIFMNDFFLSGRAEMRGFFELMPLLLAFFLPAVSMRLLAEERRQRTLEMLLTLPLVPLQVVLGKFAAALLLLLLFMAGSLPVVFMLFRLGDPDPGLLVSGYLGLFLLGAMFLSFGLFLSSLVQDQIVAFVTSTLLGFAFVLTGNDRVVAVLDGLWPAAGLGTALYEGFSIAPHYQAFVGGVVSLPALLYFTLFPALFLWLCALVLQRHRA